MHPQQPQKYRAKKGDNWPRAPALAAVLGAFAIGVLPKASLADEGGVSFWLPGTFGSLAAVPPEPGWSLGTYFYHTSVTAGANVARARQITIGQFNPTLNLNLTASLHAHADFVFVSPAYTFATPVLGGRATVGLGTLFGKSSATVSGTLTASLPPFTFVRSNSFAGTDTTGGNGDLYPVASLNWNQGVNNFMVYGTGDVPLGQYSSKSLANLGIGHGAADGGAGYTYLDLENGREFSSVAGFTYNLKNNSTNYQNGGDFHLDWGISQFLSEQLHAGLVGYLYNQITGDSGSGDRVGSFKSPVVGIRPQIGYILPLGQAQGYLNLKAYGEFDSRDHLQLVEADVSRVGAAPRRPVVAEDIRNL
jgi:hypothetical protein